MRLSRVGIAFAVVCLLGGAVAAQQPAGAGVSLQVVPITPEVIRGQFVYSVKFLCGKIPEETGDPQDPASGFFLAPGSYLTAINIANPNLNVSNPGAPSPPLTFTKVALLTNPEGQSIGITSNTVSDTIGPNTGVEVDCTTIPNLFTQPSPNPVFFTFFKGFLIIRSPKQLEVFGVYTLKNVVFTSQGTPTAQVKH